MVELRFYRAEVERLRAGFFNDERVVRAVADCSISDYRHWSSARSVLGLVADACALTPTAAEQVVPEQAELYAQHRQRIALNEVVNQQLVSAKFNCKDCRN